MNKGEGASAGHNMNSGWLLIRTMVNIDANANNGNTQVCADLKKYLLKAPIATSWAHSCNMYHTNDCNF